MAARARPEAPQAVQDDLIFDIGMNVCEDTDFYLKKGFRVVAVEANPAACEAAQARYPAEVATGRLKILNLAVAASREPLLFHVCPNESAWSTTSDSLRARWSAEGAEFQTIEVQACTTEDLLRRFGVPYYAKIDIEGSDITCLRGFAGHLGRPAYLSVEVDFYRLDELFDCMKSLGYSSFALVGQQRMERQVPPEPAREGRYVDHPFTVGCSGLFGRELPAEWVSAKEARRNCQQVISQYRYSGLLKRLEPMFPMRSALASFRERRFPLAQDWYDLHAAL